MSTTIKTEETLFDTHKQIKRADVLRLIFGLNGAMFYAVFTSRKTGETRSGLYTTNSRKYDRTGQGMAYVPADYNLLLVCDLHAARRRKAGVLNASGKAIADDRCIPIEGIQVIRTKGTTYIVVED